MHLQPPRDDECFTPRRRVGDAATNRLRRLQLKGREVHRDNGGEGLTLTMDNKPLLDALVEPLRFFALVRKLFLAPR